MKPQDYLDQLPNALSAVGFSFVNNEHKHGEGLHFSTVRKELSAGVGHSGLHAGAGVSKYTENKEDQCLHLASAAARHLKALELFLRENPEYIVKYNRVIAPTKNHTSQDKKGVR